MIRFERVTLNDAEEQLDLMKEAFMPLYEKYKEGPTSPVNTTYEMMKKRIENPKGVYLKIIRDNLVVGGIYAYIVDDNNEEMCLLSLYISPAMQNEGLAQIAIKELEHRCTFIKKWFLKVPEKEMKNRYICEKFGYIMTDEKLLINDKLTLLIYEKYKDN